MKIFTDQFKPKSISLNQSRKKISAEDWKVGPYDSVDYKQKSEKRSVRNVPLRNFARHREERERDRERECVCN